MPSPLDSDNAANRRAVHEQLDICWFPLKLAPDTISDLNAKIRSAFAQQLRWNRKCSACDRNLVTDTYLLVFRIIESKPRQCVVFGLPCETMLSRQVSKSHN